MKDSRISAELAPRGTRAGEPGAREKRTGVPAGMEGGVGGGPGVPGVKLNRQRPSMSSPTASPSEPKGTATTGGPPAAAVLRMDAGPVTRVVNVGDPGARE